MSVILETSKGDIVIDLFAEDCPKTCTNFLKLCKIKYYNNCLFYNVQPNFLVQTGDPTNTGRGGESIYGVMYGDQARFFEDEIRPELKHKQKGVVGMASRGEDANGSQFYITTAADLASLDGNHTIFGEVVEGWEVLEAINDVPCDISGRPLQNIRIRHTIVLDDPTDDPVGLQEHVPDASPAPQYAEDGRLEDDWVPDEDARPPEEVDRGNREKEAHNRAVVLEMIGDLPEADAKPPSNVLFVCKLNPVTSEEDLETIFSRFGVVTACDIIRDWKTGDSLCYAFIGFDSERACEEAYYKMNNVLIDDRRIRVDFSQSVHHLWKQFKRFGRRGDAQLGSEAAGHERPGREHDAGTSGRLELKERYRSQLHGSGRRYDLILEGPVEEAPRRYEQSGSPLAHRDRTKDEHRQRDRERERREEGRHRRRDERRKERRRSPSPRLVDKESSREDRYRDSRRREERRRSRSRSRH